MSRTERIPKMSRNTRWSARDTTIYRLAYKRGVIDAMLIQLNKDLPLEQQRPLSLDHQLIAEAAAEAAEEWAEG